MEIWQIGVKEIIEMQVTIFFVVKDTNYLGTVSAEQNNTYETDNVHTVPQEFHGGGPLRRMCLKMKWVYLLLRNKYDAAILLHNCGLWSHSRSHTRECHWLGSLCGRYAIHVPTHDNPYCRILSALC